MDTDFIVIGAGISGLSLVWKLRENGFQKLIIDLLTDFSRAYHQLRFHPGPAAEAQLACWQEPLQTLRHTATQLHSHLKTHPL